ncbi:hypothetical protein D3C72_1747850 [compost metagenome]
MDVDQGLGRLGAVQQGIALGRVLAHAGADDQQQVGVLDPRHQPGVRAEAKVARIAGVIIADQILATEGQGDGQAQALGPARNRVGGGVGPAGPAEDQHGALGLGQTRLYLFDKGRV